MLIVLLLVVFPSSVADFILSCYYRFNQPSPAEVPGDICTHIILIGHTVLDHLGHFQQPPKDVAQQFLEIKKNFPNVKLLLCQTGSNPDFSTLVASEETMLRYANESSSYLREIGFDGLDLDWEFPSWSWDAKRNDKHEFTKLLKILRNSFGKDLLLTAAVAGPPTITKVAYDINAFNQLNKSRNPADIFRYLDLIQVMNYDFHVFSWTNPVVGFNAPLRKLNRGEVGPIGKMNSAAAMETYRNMGLWENKTLFGIPTYNLAYLLVNSYLYKPYSLAENVVYGYETRSSICELLRHKENYKYVWNEKAASPYVHGTDKIWISIEDERSVTAKSSYAMELNLPGVMIFHIGADDVSGLCGNGTYPLLKAIQRVVHMKSNKV